MHCFSYSQALKTSFKPCTAFRLNLPNKYFYNRCISKPILFLGQQEAGIVIEICCMRRRRLLTVPSADLVDQQSEMTHHRQLKIIPILIQETQDREHIKKKCYNGEDQKTDYNINLRTRKLDSPLHSGSRKKKYKQQKHPMQIGVDRRLVQPRKDNRQSISSFIRVKALDIRIDQAKTKAYLKKTIQNRVRVVYMWEERKLNPLKRQKEKKETFVDREKVISNC